MPGRVAEISVTVATSKVDDLPMNSRETRQMQIGEVADRTELSIRTVRHYDEVGLVTPSARSAGGFRLYTEGDVERLLVIRRMKPLGFSLVEMRDLLDSLAALDDPRSSAVQRRRAAELLAGFREKADESAVRLRKHLAYADELVGILRAHSSGVLS